MADLHAAYDVEVEKFATGGSSTVHFAQSLYAEEKAVIKIALPHSKAMVMLKCEAKYLSSIQHPNIVSLHSVFNFKLQVQVDRFSFCPY